MRKILIISAITIFRLSWPNNLIFSQETWLSAIKVNSSAFQSLISNYNAEILNNEASLILSLPQFGINLSSIPSLEIINNRFFPGYNGSVFVRIPLETEGQLFLSLNDSISSFSMFGNDAFSHKLSFNTEINLPLYFDNKKITLNREYDKSIFRIRNQISKVQFELNKNDLYFQALKSMLLYAKSKNSMQIAQAEFEFQKKISNINKSLLTSNQLSFDQYALSNIDYVNSFENYQKSMSDLANRKKEYSLFIGSKNVDRWTLTIFQIPTLSIEYNPSSLWNNYEMEIDSLMTSLEYELFLNSQLKSAGNISLGYVSETPPLTEEYRYNNWKDSFGELFQAGSTWQHKFLLALKLYTTFGQENSFTSRQAYQNYRKSFDNYKKFKLLNLKYIDSLKEAETQILKQKQMENEIESQLLEVHQQLIIAYQSNMISEVSFDKSSLAIHRIQKMRLNTEADLLLTKFELVKYLSPNTFIEEIEKLWLIDTPQI